MTTHIRKGTRADLPAVLDLIKDLAEYEKALDEVSFLSALIIYLLFLRYSLSKLLQHCPNLFVLL